MLSFVYPLSPFPRQVWVYCRAYCLPQPTGTQIALDDSGMTALQLHPFAKFNIF